MKPVIAIVAGGDTSEFGVSLRSAEGLCSFIDNEKYALYVVEMRGADWHVRLPQGGTSPVDRGDFSFELEGRRVRFDFAYITIHGTPGEDGLLQGYLDMLRIPYSSCGVLASALTYDKFACNHYLHGFGVRIADSLLLRRGQTIGNDEVADKIGLPCFVKPSRGGSSFGVTKVSSREQIQPALQKAFAEADEVLLQQFETVKEVVSNVRAIRLQKNIAQKEVLELQVVGENPVATFNAVLTKMCNLSAIAVVESKAEGAAAFMVGTAEYAVPLGNLIDVEAEIARMEAELKHKESFLQGVLKKLGNEKFVSHAPAAVVELERKKQADAESIIRSLKEGIAAMRKK